MSADKNIETIPGESKPSAAAATAQGRFSPVTHLDMHLVKSFAAPFLAIFFLTLFILVMQFLWVYVDELVGKGLEWYVIAQLLFYSSAAMVPLALPLATLLSTMMTIGNLAEHYEITALKSSGISLWRIIRSLLVLAVFISGLALLFANYVLPIANLKAGALLYDVRRQRPALNIKEGFFYREIDGYSIRVGKKAPDNRTIYDVLIYDHVHGKGNDYVITADSGEMYMTEDKRYLVLELFNGRQFQELNPSPRPGSKYEQLRVSFREWKKIFDLSEFILSRTNEELFKANYKMQNLRQLRLSMDSTKQDVKKAQENVRSFSKPYYVFERNNLDSLLADTGKTNGAVPRVTRDSVSILAKAISNARNMKGYLEFAAKSQEGKEDMLNRYRIEWQRKFSLSAACLVLFLFGASLGAIIRKGGFGLPFVISVFFFIIFYIISIAGEKMAKEGVLSAFGGMWFSTFILFPLALYLTYKANRDSALFNTEAYLMAARKALSRIPWFRD